MVGGVEQRCQSRCGVDSKAPDWTGLLGQVGSQFDVAHRREPAHVLAQVQTEPTVGLIRIAADADDRRVIGLTPEKFGKHETVFGLDEVRDSRFVGEAHEALP